jgi:hypothetical protein
MIKNMTDRIDAVNRKRFRSLFKELISSKNYQSTHAPRANTRFAPTFIARASIILSQLHDLFVGAILVIARTALISKEVFGIINLVFGREDNYFDREIKFIFLHPFRLRF